MNAEEMAYFENKEFYLNKKMAENILDLSKNLNKMMDDLRNDKSEFNHLGGEFYITSLASMISIFMKNLDMPQRLMIIQFLIRSDQEIKDIEKDDGFILFKKDLEEKLEKLRK